MNSCKRVRIISCFILIAGVFLSCGARHKLVDDLIYKDEKFTYQNLKGDGLIVGGVASDVLKISRKERLEYSSTFSQILIEKLKDASLIQITNPTQLIDHMGQTSYFGMMEDLDTEKTLSNLWADSLQTILPDARFILFAYIVNENIVDESHDRYVESAEGQELETEYEKTYYITVEFLLYDIFRKELVWNNSVFNKAHRTESRTTQSGCLESCINDLFQNILFGEPAEISRKEVFAKIVEKFAEDIAKI